MTWSVLAAAMLLLVVAPGGSAEPREGLGAASSAGAVSFAFFGGPATTVNLGEQVGDALLPLSTVRVPPEGVVGLPAVPWRCDRLVRTFVADTIEPDGSHRRYSTDVKTPACTTRLTVSVPRHVDRGSPLTVRISDRWTTGRGVEVCTVGAGLPRACGPVTLPPGGRQARVVVRPPADGTVRIAVTFDAFATHRTTGVGRAPVAASPALPVLLATGDSTMQGITSFLSDRLAGVVSVDGDTHPGSGVSITTPVDWRTLPTLQVRAARPSVTVMSIGANDGYPLGGSACCGPDWQTAYARRVRTMMRRYTAQGGRLLWLLFPTPAEPARARIVAAVSHAVTTAAQGLPLVATLDLNPALAPGGVFHTAIDVGGRQVVVRQSDGLHLTVAGAGIAADRIVAALDARHWLGA